MGKKTSELSKYREWERERRERLNVSFNDLGSLLPNHDPAALTSKVDILQKSAAYIRDLKKENSDLLLGGSNKIQAKKIKRLQRYVEVLLVRIQQLAKLLKDAGISLPPEPPSITPLGEKPLRWSNKITPKDADKVLQIMEKTQNNNGPAQKKTKSSKKTGKKDTNASPEITDETDAESPAKPKSPSNSSKSSLATPSVNSPKATPKKPTPEPCNHIVSLKEVTPQESRPPLPVSQLFSDSSGMLTSLPSHVVSAEQQGGIIVIRTTGANTLGAMTQQTPQSTCIVIDNTNGGVVGNGHSRTVVASHTPVLEQRPTFVLASNGSLLPVLSAPQFVTQPRQLIVSTSSPPVSHIKPPLAPITFPTSGSNPPCINPPIKPLREVACSPRSSKGETSKLKKVPIPALPRNKTKHVPVVKDVKDGTDVSTKVSPKKKTDSDVSKMSKNGSAKSTEKRTSKSQQEISQVKLTSPSKSIPQDGKLSANTAEKSGNDKKDTAPTTKLSPKVVPAESRKREFDVKNSDDSVQLKRKKSEGVSSENQCLPKASVENQEIISPVNLIDHNSPSCNNTTFNPLSNTCSVSSYSIDALCKMNEKITADCSNEASKGAVSQIKEKTHQNDTNPNVTSMKGQSMEVAYLSENVPSISSTAEIVPKSVSTFTTSETHLEEREKSTNDSINKSFEHLNKDSDREALMQINMSVEQSLQQTDVNNMRSNTIVTDCGPGNLSPNRIESSYPPIAKDSASETKEKSDTQTLILPSFGSCPSFSHPSSDVYRKEDDNRENNCESSMDENSLPPGAFSSDLFASLQVPSGHSESISPTAAFLLAFPLVSTLTGKTPDIGSDNHPSQPLPSLDSGNGDSEHSSGGCGSSFLQLGNLEDNSPSSSSQSILSSLSSSSAPSLQSNVYHLKANSIIHSILPPTIEPSYGRETVDVNISMVERQSKVISSKNMVPKEQSFVSPSSSVVLKENQILPEQLVSEDLPSITRNETSTSKIQSLKEATSDCKHQMNGKVGSVSDMNEVSGRYPSQIHKHTNCDDNSIPSTSVPSVSNKINTHLCLNHQLGVSRRENVKKTSVENNAVPSSNQQYMPYQLPYMSTSYTESSQPPTNSDNIINTVDSGKNGQGNLRQEMQTIANGLNNSSSNQQIVCSLPQTSSSGTFSTNVRYKTEKSHSENSKTNIQNNNYAPPVYSQYNSATSLTSPMPSTSCFTISSFTSSFSSSGSNSLLPICSVTSSSMPFSSNSHPMSAPSSLPYTAANSLLPISSVSSSSIPFSSNSHPMSAPTTLSYTGANSLLPICSVTSSSMPFSSNSHPMTAPTSLSYTGANSLLPICSVTSSSMPFSSNSHPMAAPTSLSYTGANSLLPICSVTSSSMPFSSNSHPMTAPTSLSYTGANSLLPICSVTSSSMPFSSNSHPMTAPTSLSYTGANSLLPICSVTSSSMPFSSNSHPMTAPTSLSYTGANSLLPICSVTSSSMPFSSSSHPMSAPTSLSYASSTSFSNSNSSYLGSSTSYIPPIYTNTTTQSSSSSSASFSNATFSLVPDPIISSTSASKTTDGTSKTSVAIASGNQNSFGTIHNNVMSNLPPSSFGNSTSSVNYNNGQKLNSHSTSNSHQHCSQTKNSSGSQQKIHDQSHSSSTNHLVAESAKSHHIFSIDQLNTQNYGYNYNDYASHIPNYSPQKSEMDMMPRKPPNLPPETSGGNIPMRMPGSFSVAHNSSNFSILSWTTLSPMSAAPSSVDPQANSRNAKPDHGSVGVSPVENCSSTTMKPPDSHSSSYTQPALTETPVITSSYPQFAMGNSTNLGTELSGPNSYSLTQDIGKQTTSRGNAQKQRQQVTNWMTAPDPIHSSSDFNQNNDNMNNENARDGYGSTSTSYGSNAGFYGHHNHLDVAYIPSSNTSVGEISLDNRGGMQSSVAGTNRNSQKNCSNNSEENSSLAENILQLQPKPSNGHQNHVLPCAYDKMNSSASYITHSQSELPALPTLVGDLALGSCSSVKGFLPVFEENNVMPPKVAKYASGKGNLQNNNNNNCSNNLSSKDNRDNRNTSSNHEYSASTFLSVSQLVDHVKETSQQNQQRENDRGEKNRNRDTSKNSPPARRNIRPSNVKRETGVTNKEQLEYSQISNSRVSPAEVQSFQNQGASSSVVPSNPTHLPAPPIPFPPYKSVHWPVNEMTKVMDSSRNNTNYKSSNSYSAEALIRPSLATMPMESRLPDVELPTIGMDIHKFSIPSGRGDHIFADFIESSNIGCNVDTVHMPQNQLKQQSLDQRQENEHFRGGHSHFNYSSNGAISSTFHSHHPSLPPPNFTNQEDYNVESGNNASSLGLPPNCIDFPFSHPKETPPMTSSASNVCLPLSYSPTSTCIGVNENHSQPCRTVEKTLTRISNGNCEGNRSMIEHLGPSRSVCDGEGRIKQQGAKPMPPIMNNNTRSIPSFLPMESNSTPYLGHHHYHPHSHHNSQSTYPSSAAVGPASIAPINDPEHQVPKLFPRLPPPASGMTHLAQQNSVVNSSTGCGSTSVGNLSSGTLTNFNLSTIFPEINDKQNHHNQMLPSASSFGKSSKNDKLGAVSSSSSAPLLHPPPPLSTSYHTHQPHQHSQFPPPVDLGNRLPHPHPPSSVLHSNVGFNNLMVQSTPQVNGIAINSSLQPPPPPFSGPSFVNVLPGM